jgi:hypothetical protein
MDAFTARLGTSEGRVTQDDGTIVFVLGDLQAGRFHDLVPGDYVEIAQTANLTGIALVRVRGALRAPAAGSWRVSLRVGGVEVAGLAGWAGKTRSVSDLAANVSALAAPTEIAVRLTLVAAS